MNKRRREKWKEGGRKGGINERKERERERGGGGREGGREEGREERRWVGKNDEHADTHKIIDIYTSTPSLTH